jgi:hypothetical protein
MCVLSRHTKAPVGDSAVRLRSIAAVAMQKADITGMTIKLRLGLSFATDPQISALVAGLGVASVASVNDTLETCVQGLTAASPFAARSPNL